MTEREKFEAAWASLSLTKAGCMETAWQVWQAARASSEAKHGTYADTRGTYAEGASQAQDESEIKRLNAELVAWRVRYENDRAALRAAPAQPAGERVELCRWPGALDDRSRWHQHAHARRIPGYQYAWATIERIK